MGKRELGGERADCLTLFDLLVSCDCYWYVALPRGVVGWSAWCDLVIALSYSRAYLVAYPCTDINRICSCSSHLSMKFKLFKIN